METETVSPLYVIEYKNERGRWVRSKFARPMVKDVAEEFAAECDDHGNTVRVVVWR
jgi:hypothetical protein